RKARRLNFKNRSRRVNESIGGTDDFIDVYRFNARSSTIDITARRLGNRPEFKLYRVDQKLGRTLRRIGKKDFDDIRPKQRDRFLTEVELSSTGGSNNRTYTADVERGDFFLVVSTTARKRRKYNLRFVASPLESSSTDTPTGNDGTDTTTTATPGSTTAPTSGSPSTPNSGFTPTPSNPPGTDTIGNAIDASKLITIGGSESERIGGADPFDFFRFELGDRQKVSLTLKGLSENADLALFNSNGGELRVSNGVGTVEDSIIRTLDPGTYYIRVSSTSTAETAYALVTANVAFNQRALYTPNGSNSPESGGELEFVQLPFTPAEATEVSNIVAANTAFNSAQVTNQLNAEELIATANATETIVSSGVQLNTQVNNSNTGYVGYTNHSVDYSTISTTDLITGNLSADLDPVSLNGLPVLDADIGYSLSFEVAINTEASSSSDRAGFSVLVVSSDGQRAIELGFNSTGIFAQSQNLTAENRFTPSGFAMSDFVTYNLRVVGSGYELFANGSRVVAGLLQQPYNFDPNSSDPSLPFNPYTTPNFIFLGDNTDQSSATFTLGDVSVQT
ncbi:MAG: hypothetical protein F6K09_07215, partial [Merismopedia sp. SIO2A8]|nr:hypothetical protein [Merismopedia sp. SIO2A8]